MKKTTTRLLSLLLVLCMVLTLVPAVAAEAPKAEVTEPEYFTSTDWIWSSNNVIRNSVSYFRNDYTLKGTPTAIDVRVSAHNHVKFYVNGNIVTGYVSPAPTALPENINYLSYSFTGEELTALLNTDPTQLALAAAVQYMGNGGMNYVAAKPGLWAEVTVTYADGSEVLVTDGSWTALENNPYKGNTPNMSSRQMNAQIDYDARKMPDPLAWTKFGYDETGWTAAVDADPITDTYKLRQQNIPEGRVHEEITPKAVGRQQVGWQVFDVGRIATGWVKLTASAPAGTRICIRYSEDLQGDVVRHNVANEGSETYCDYYTFSGNGKETFIADFDYKSFRYFEVTGLTEMITVEDVTMQWASTGVDYTADFSSDSEMLNKIYQACINTQVNNLEGMPVDCPHREQSQYLADSQLQYALLSYAFSNFSDINYKTLLDFAAQQLGSGRFTFVAPSQMYASSDSIPEWDLRYSNMLYKYYWTSGDVEGMSYFYDDAVENVTYYYDRLDGTGLLPDINGWNISDHPEKHVPDDPGKAPTVANILLYDSLNHLSKMADLLGKDDDAADWAAKAKALKAAINANLLDHESGQYLRYFGDSTTNPGVTAMAINLGVSDPALLEQQMVALSQPISNTSVVLTYELFFAVMEHGTAAQKESVYNRIMSTWGQMINRGDSTCWEGFRDENSHSHAWTAYPARIMLQYFLGVSYNGVSYSDIAVKPFLPAALNTASGHVTVPNNGQVGVTLTRGEGTMTVEVENTTDESILVAVPRVAGNTVVTEATLGKVFENGKGANVEGLAYVSNDAEYVYFRADAGKNVALTASAAAAQTGTFVLNVEAVLGGTVTINGAAVELPYMGSVEAGTEVTVEAKADTNYAFTGWSGTYGSVKSKYTFTVGSNVDLTANFELREGTIYRTVTIDAPAGCGLQVKANSTTISLPGKIAVEAGELVELEIYETEGSKYTFEAWSGPIFSTGRTMKLVVEENMELKVLTAYRGSTVGNLALGKSATFSDGGIHSPSLWTMANLTDGNIPVYVDAPLSSGAIGATSNGYSTPNTNVSLTLDLGKDTKFDEVVLYARYDAKDDDGQSRCFPTSYSVSVCKNGAGSYETVYSVTDAPLPKSAPVKIKLDKQEARYIRVTATNLGLPDNHGVSYYFQVGEMEVYNSSSAEEGKADLNIAGKDSVLVNGELKALPLTESYAYGTKLVIVPVANEGRKFVGWSGDVVSKDVPLYVTMDNSVDLMAGFSSMTTENTGNLALNGKVTVPASKVDGVGSEQWKPEYLTDGLLTSTGATAAEGKKGFTSINYASPNLPDESLYVEIDMGKDVDFNTLTLWPRTDVFGAGRATGLSPNFPVAFKVQYCLNGDSVWRDIKTFSDVENPMGEPVSFDLGLQNGRHIRIIPITLGAPASDDASGTSPYRFQLAEIEVFGNALLSNNLGTSASKITSNDSGSHAGAWSLENLVDGQVRSAGRGSEEGTKGFTSGGYGAEQKDISATPHDITFEFAAPTDMNQVILYPRSDLDGDTPNSGLAANFPEDYTIQVKDENGEWKVVYTATGVNNGLSPVICDFDTHTTTGLRLVTTRLGVCASDEGSRALRVQLAEFKIGNVIRGEVSEGSITLEPAEINIDSFEDMIPVQAIVEASTVGGDAIVWSVEDENGNVSDLAVLNFTSGNNPVLIPKAEGTAYLVARFANGLNTMAKAPITIAVPKFKDITVNLRSEGDISIMDEAATFVVSAKDMLDTATANLTLELPVDVLGEPELTGLNGWYVIGYTYENGVLDVTIGNHEATSDEGFVDILSISMAPTGEPGDARVLITEALFAAYEGEGERFINGILGDCDVTIAVTHNRYDVNRDGIVDLLDITRAQRYYGLTEESEKWYADADVNNDGIVNITDMILVMNNYTR